MARVGVEQKALSDSTDPRYKILAELIGVDRWSVLGRMCVVWSACQDNYTHTLPRNVLDVLGGVPGFADAMVAAELGQRLRGGRIRIKGTARRISTSPPQQRTACAFWRRLRLLIFARDGHQCVYCGATGVPLECDHVIPITRGGTDDPNNLTTACKPCNASKNDRTPEEWRA